MNCKNCKNNLQENSDYCNRCGGKVIRNRLTFKNLFEHISETFFNYDNKLLRTFLNLFKSPEDVIGGYINGTRKKYVNVISYFALAITLSGLQIYIIQKFQTDFTFYDTSTEIGRKQQEVFSKIFNFSTDYQSLVMMSYIPFYALLAKIVFYDNKKFNYTELIVVFLYAQAQVSICIALITAILIPLNIVSFTTISLFIFPLMFLYFTYCLKRVYGLNKLNMLVKTLIFIVLLGIAMVLIITASTVFMFKSGMFDDMIEAKKALKKG
ncbi:DUF3667 domain-containing protein [Ichthyenterobacterium magnum]|uniref:Uncharacterized protein DUF3667 n=1 Tax=Ichthyenterobacterium magnum TaxID=1230530 RepID=A0A420DEU9_9FLAO|nr:DUF3667 domain-containing protein [Ichthyenterobacterium magnum]RKE90783.1 uncharacterized protein DUF3667 [Ichthyenterobacterium magnum]